MTSINTILITGSSRGLGYALALHFAQHGQTVFAVGRDAAALAKLQKKFPTLIRPIATDMTTEDGRKLIAAQVLATKQPISIIHNAAIAQTRAFANVDEKLFIEHFATNVFAPLLLTQACLPALAAGQRILHISSAAGSYPLENQLVYCATKAALEHANRCLNVELAERSIYAGILWPGIMDTPMAEKLRTQFEPTARALYIKLQEQLLEPSLVAQFVAWVLLNTNNSEFSNKTWNIYDSEQQAHWLPKDRQAPTYNAS